MKYIMYYSDYHSHIHNDEFSAPNDEVAKNKFTEKLNGLGYDDDSLYRIEEDGTHTKIY